MEFKVNNWVKKAAKLTSIDHSELVVQTNASNLLPSSAIELSLRGFT